MLAGLEVRQLQRAGQWIVTSASAPGAAYETDCTSCICRAAQQGGDPVCLHRAACWHHQGVLDFDGGPASPAPSQPVDKLIESFGGELDYLTGALTYIAAMEPKCRRVA